MNSWLCISLLIFTSLTFRGDLPDHVGYINDFENILSDKEEEKLSKMVMDHEKTTSNEIAVVTVSTIEPYSEMFEFSLAIANKWKVGKAAKNNGVLIVVSKTLREIRIQNGLGISERLSDEETKLIIDKYMIPAFKKGKYFQGIEKGLNAIMKEII